MNSSPAKSLPLAFDGGTGEIAYLFKNSLQAGCVTSNLTLDVPLLEVTLNGFSFLVVHQGF